MYNQLIARAKADQEGILPMDDPKFSAKKNGSIAAMAESPYAVNVQPFYAQLPMCFVMNRLMAWLPLLI